MALKPAGYSECVSVTDGPSVRQRSVASFCDFIVDARFREAVNIGNGLSPVWYRSNVICHTTTTKKNYKTSVEYVPKMKPLRHQVTQYLRPKHLVRTFVSYVDYTANDQQKWYTTSVQLVPTRNQNNHGNKIPYDTVTSDDYGQNVVVPSEQQNDINMNIIGLHEKIEIQRFPQPPLLISSGPEGNTDGSVYEERMTHRTKMVVKTAPSQRMRNEDRIVYLKGYASTGDVIRIRPHAWEGDDDIGYLSGDTTDV